MGVPLAAYDRRRLVMDSELAITVRRERGVVIVAVSGDIDISTVTRLPERLSGLADGGQALIVDLNPVTFIDSAGLGALVGAARRAAAHGGNLHAVYARSLKAGSLIPNGPGYRPRDALQVKRRSAPCSLSTCMPAARIPRSPPCPGAWRAPRYAGGAEACKRDRGRLVPPGYHGSNLREFSQVRECPRGI